MTSIKWLLFYWNYYCSFLAMEEWWCHSKVKTSKDSVTRRSEHYSTKKKRKGRKYKKLGTVVELDEKMNRWTKTMAESSKDYTSKLYKKILKLNINSSFMFRNNYFPTFCNSSQIFTPGLTTITLCRQWCYIINDLQETVCSSFLFLAINEWRWCSSLVAVINN